jgi:hypothetical protein
VNALIKRMNSFLFDQQVASSNYKLPYLHESGASIVGAGYLTETTTRLGLTNETAIWGTTAISGPNSSQAFTAASRTTGIWETATTSNN